MAWPWSSTIVRSRHCAASSSRTRPKPAFVTSNYALLVGARPRGPGMERKDLLLANAQIFSAQGKALERRRRPQRKDPRRRQSGEHERADRAREREGSRSAQFHGHDAPRPQPRQSTACGQDRASRHRRRRCDHLGQSFSHSVPGSRARHGRRGTGFVARAARMVSRTSSFPTVQQRGAAIIKARGASSAASAASAAIDHIHDWALGTAGEDWVSMGVASDGSYGIPEGVVYSYPVTLLAAAATNRPRARHRRFLPRQNRGDGRGAYVRSAQALPNCFDYPHRREPGGCD